MKHGPVTKLDMRNKTTSKFNIWRHVRNCNVILIFPIYGQFGAMRMPDSGCIICKTYIFINSNLFFYQGFLSRTLMSQENRGRKGTIFYSTLALPPVHEHLDIYLHLCMWDDYHIFLIASLVFTRLLLNEIYHLIWLMTCVNFCSFTWWLDFQFLLQQFVMGNRWTWTRMDYHPCITSKPTNQVC